MSRDTLHQPRRPVLVLLNRDSSRALDGGLHISPLLAIFGTKMAEDSGVWHVLRLKKSKLGIIKTSNLARSWWAIAL